LEKLMIFVPARPRVHHLERKLVSQITTPVCKLKHSLQPFCFACSKQSAKRDVDITPLWASEVVPGFPMTSLLNGTPLAAIWKRADWGALFEDVMSEFSQVIYSFGPSA